MIGIHGKKEYLFINLRPENHSCACKITEKVDFLALVYPIYYYYKPCNLRILLLTVFSYPQIPQAARTPSTKLDGNKN